MPSARQGCLCKKWLKYLARIRCFGSNQNLLAVYAGFADRMNAQERLISYGFFGAG
jgi:hypothetical protein